MNLKFPSFHFQKAALILGFILAVKRGTDPMKIISSSICSSLENDHSDWLLQVMPKHVHLKSKEKRDATETAFALLN